MFAYRNQRRSNWQVVLVSDTTIAETSCLSFHGTSSCHDVVAILMQLEAPLLTSNWRDITASLLHLLVAIFLPCCVLSGAAETHPQH